MCSSITGRFGEASQDGRSDSGEQGIISDYRKKIKGQGRLHKAKMNKFGKTWKKIIKEGRNVWKNNKKGKYQGKSGQKKKDSQIWGKGGLTLFQVVKPEKKSRKK